MNPNPLVIDWGTKDENELRRNARMLVRFLKHCEKGEDGLLRWAGCTNRKGYGGFQVGSKRAVGAHRMAYALLVDMVPKGICVCHKNDEPGCVDPSVLFLGTKGDNNTDRSRKGRSGYVDNRGVRNGQAKLTPKQVREIRDKYNPEAGITQRVLAREYGVCRETVGYVTRHQTWSHI